MYRSVLCIVCVIESEVQYYFMHSCRCDRISSMTLGYLELFLPWHVFMLYLYVMLIMPLTHCGLVTAYGARSGSTLAQVMAWCLMAPSHYLNQCWLLISEVIFCSMHLRGIPQVSKLQCCIKILKIILLKLMPHIPGVNELMQWRMSCWYLYAILVYLYIHIANYMYTYTRYDRTACSYEYCIYTCVCIWIRFPYSMDDMIPMMHLCRYHLHCSCKWFAFFGIPKSTADEKI